MCGEGKNKRGNMYYVLKTGRQGGLEFLCDSYELIHS